MHTHIHTYTHIYTYKHIHTNIMHKHIHTYIHRYTHIYIHTHIHTYMDGCQDGGRRERGHRKRSKLNSGLPQEAAETKKELKNIIFHTVSNLRKLFAKLVDTNENNNSKITELEKNAANTKELRGVGKREENNHIVEPSSAKQRNTHCQTKSKVYSPIGRTVKLYSEAVVGKITQKVYKLTVTSRDNQTAETIKEMLKTNKPGRNKGGNRIR